MGGGAGSGEASEQVALVERRSGWTAAAGERCRGPASGSPWSRPAPRLRGLMPFQGKGAASGRIASTPRHHPGRAAAPPTVPRARQRTFVRAACDATARRQQRHHGLVSTPAPRQPAASSSASWDPAAKCHGGHPPRGGRRCDRDRGASDRPRRSGGARPACCPETHGVPGGMHSEHEQPRRREHGFDRPIVAGPQNHDAARHSGTAPPWYAATSTPPLARGQLAAAPRITTRWRFVPLGIMRRAHRGALSIRPSLPKCAQRKQRCLCRSEALEAHQKLPKRTAWCGGAALQRPCA